ncbi:MAG: polysaccharide deacetylase family protein [Acidobacteriota bacterium]
MPRRRFAVLSGILTVCLILAASVVPASAQGLSASTRGVPLPGNGPRAYISIVIDDLINLDLWSQLVADCEAYGIKATLALNTAKATPEDYARMAKAVAGGHEIANHTRDHVPVAPGGVVKLRYSDANAQSAYVAVDAEKAVLRIMAGDKPEPVAELDLSENGRNHSLKQLVDSLNAVRGVTAELGDPYYANIHSRFLLGKDKTDIFFKNGLAPLFVDIAANARYEIEGAKKDIEAGIPGYTPRSMVYPFLVSDAVSRQVAGELGNDCGRVGTAGNAALGSPAGYDLYRIFAIKPRDAFGADPAAPEFSLKVNAFLKKIKEVGGVLCLYSHGPDEFTNEQWKALLPLLAQDKEIAYVTLHDLSAFVRKTAQLRDGVYYLPEPKAQPEAQPQAQPEKAKSQAKGKKKGK